MPLASRSEVFIEKMPGGTSPIRELKGQQEQQFRNLQEILMGKPGTDEEVGQKAIEAIRGKIEPAVTGEAAAREALGKQAQSAIEDMLAKATHPERQIYKTELGKEIRENVIGKRDAAKAEADRLFGVVRSIPGGEGKIFDGGGLQADFAKIKKALPSPEQTVSQPSALVDLFGKAITPTAKAQPVLREFVPQNVLSRLDSVIGLKGAKFSLSDLQQMRREVYDDISKGEGVPGLGTHYLADVGEALTKAIDRGVTSLPSGDLKTALQAANEHYKTKVVPFNRQGLTDLFRRADEVGHVSDFEVVSRLLGSDKAVRNWQLMKETLGAGPAFDKMKRAVADNIVEHSRLPGDTTIDAKSFIKGLYDFRLKYPEIARDVFSGKENELFRQGRFLTYSQGDKIDETQLGALLKDKSASAPKLKILIDAERNKDEVFRNSIMKAVGEGSLNEQTLKPTEFVNRMLETAQPAEVEKILDAIGRERMQDVPVARFGTATTHESRMTAPPLLEELRQKTFEKIFRDAARNASAEDVNRIMSGQNTHILSGVKIADKLANPTYKHKIKSILGPELFQDLEQYIKLQTAPEKASQSFASAGGLAAGAQIASLEQRGLFAYLSSSARNFIFSTLLSRRPLRTWLTSIPNEPGKMSLILSNPVFLEAVTKEFGKGTAAESFMSGIKQAIDRSMADGQQQANKPLNTGNMPMDREQQWKNWLDQKR